MTGQTNGDGGAGLPPLNPEDVRRLIGLAAAAKLMRGRDGRPPSVETVRRWANPKKGCRLPGRAGSLRLPTLR